MDDFFQLFLPSYCGGCSRLLFNHEKDICTRCLISLPRTGFHDERSNKIERLFWGRTDISSATAFLQMPRHGMVHKMMHELKYKNNPQLGTRLGQLFAQELSTSKSMNHFDVVIPIPLHPKKQQLRGYNQSVCIAEGMQELLGAELILHNLIRCEDTSSQTKKNRIERWNNVGSIFQVLHSERLIHRHVLLIDDVITTGATIEGCANTLLEIPGIKLSVAALAMPIY